MCRSSPTSHNFEKYFTSFAVGNINNYGPVHMHGLEPLLAELSLASTSKRAGGYNC